MYVLSILDSIKDIELVSENRSSNLDGRHQNANGEIDRKHGNTLVGTLRETYGEDFAAGHRADMKLSTLLRESGADSPQPISETRRMKTSRMVQEGDSYGR
jgi:hypothetical protein